MRDKYANFEHLKNGETRGLDYEVQAIRRERPVAIIAPHGGKIEPGTTLIAEKIADDQYNFYSFMGLKDHGNSNLHITSSRFDEPNCVGLISKCDVIVAVHGRRNVTDPNTVWLGGRDVTLRDLIILNLKASGFLAALAPDLRLRGESPNSICNRGRRKQGVQLELPRALREMLSADGPRLNEFALAITKAIEGH
jgi:phage replication-related protein YjqB (UPF0714/DUF867 family)